MKVYIAEFKCDGSITNQITKAITKTGYAHTAMVIETNEGLNFCELDAFNAPQYHVEKVESIRKILERDNRIELYEIPADFNNESAVKGIEWWRKKKNWTYGFLKLFSFLWLAPMTGLQITYYKATGKVFEPVLGNAIKQQLVCSGACDKCLREAFGYDSFPELDEDSIYPGMWACDDRFKRRLI